MESLWVGAAKAFGLPGWMSETWPVDGEFIPETPRNIKRLAAYCAGTLGKLLDLEDAWERHMVFYLALIEFLMPGAVLRDEAGKDRIRLLEQRAASLTMSRLAGIATLSKTDDVERVLLPWGETGKKNVGLFVRASVHAERNSSKRGVSVVDLAGAIQGVPFGQSRAVEEMLGGAVMSLQSPSVLSSIVGGDQWKSLSVHERIEALYRGMLTAVRLSLRIHRAADFDVARAWGEQFVRCAHEQAAATSDPRASVLALQVGFCGLFCGFAEPASLILRGFARRVRTKSDVAWEFLGAHENRFVDAIDPSFEAEWMLGVLRSFKNLARRRVIEDFGNDAATPKVGQHTVGELDGVRRKLLLHHTSGSTVFAWRRVAGKWAKIEERLRVELAFGCLQDMAALVQEDRLNKGTVLPVSQNMLALLEEVRLSDFARRRLSIMEGVLA
jgi:hypothetical protein